MNDKNLKTLIILFKTHQNVFKNVKQSLEGTSLSLNEFTTMEALYSKGCLTTNELIDLVLIPNSSMTYVLDTLESKKYIERFKNPQDKRVQKIELTPLGQEKFSAVYDIHYALMKDVFNVLSEEEEAQLSSLLKKLGKHAEKRANQ